MGATLGLPSSSQDENTEHEAVLPLPEPQVRTGIAVGPTALLVPVAKATCIPPPELNLNRRSIPFSVARDTIEIRKLSGSSLSITFMYKSNTEISVRAKVGTKSGDAASSTWKRIMPTPAMTSESIVADFDGGSGGRDLSDATFSLELTNDEDNLLISGVIQGVRVTVKQHQLYLADEERLVDILNLFDSSCSNSPISSGEKNPRCTVCLDGDANIGFLPCRHLCVCRACSQKTLLASYNHCPICRNTVTGIIQLDK